MAKIFYKKRIFNYERDCEDEFGKYHWYFTIDLCLSKKGISWSVCTSDFFTNQKKLRDCMNDTLKHLKLDNPRYYRLKDEIVRKGLHNKLW